METGWKSSNLDMASINRFYFLKIVNAKCKFGTLHTRTHDRSICWHGTGASVKGGGVNPVLFQISPLIEINS